MCDEAVGGGDRHPAAIALGLECSTNAFSARLAAAKVKARGIIHHGMSVRYAFYTGFTGAFTLLFVYVTARFALNGGDLVGVGISGFVTIGLAFQTRRWYRRLTAHRLADNS